MDTFEAINSRRSVKHFDANHQMNDAEINQLLQAAIQSPTSFNMQNWRFVVVKDPELRQQMRQAGFDQAQFTDASLLLVLTADLNAWQNDPARYWQNAAPGVSEMMVNMMVPFYEGNESLQRDEAIRSMGLAGQTIMIAAKAMGYDSCPMIGFDQAKVGELINLPDDHVIGFAIAVGKRTQDPWPKPGQLSLDQVVVDNRF